MEKQDNALDSNEISYFNDYIRSFNAQYSSGTNFLLSPQMLNTALKDSNMQTQLYRIPDIARMVMRPHECEQELRKLSLHFFNSIGLYKQIINFWSTLLTFDWNPIPYTADGKPISASDFHSQAYKKSYAELTKFFNSFKAKQEFLKALWNICMYDTYYTSYREYDGHIYLQELPSSHCMIDAQSYLGYMFSFDMSYYMTNGVDINAYSPLMRKTYNRILKNYKGNYKPNLPNRNGNYVFWCPMLPDDCFVFKYNQNFAGSVPPLLSSMIDYAKIDKYKDLEDMKKKLETYKVIFASVPRLTGNKTNNKADDFAVSSDELGKFVGQVKKSLSDVDFKAVPLTDLKMFDFTPSGNEPDLLDTALKNVMLQSGTTSALSLTDTVNVAGADIFKTYNNSVLSSLYGQFSNFCEYHINKKCNKIKWKIQFIGTQYDKSTRLSDSNNDLERGIITPNIYSSRGIQLTDAQNITNMMYSMGYPDILKPALRSSVMSSKDTKTNGRPQKEDSQLSESAEASRNSQGVKEVEET